MICFVLFCPVHQCIKKHTFEYCKLCHLIPWGNMWMNSFIRPFIHTILAAAGRDINCEVSHSSRRPLGTGTLTHRMKCGSDCRFVGLIKRIINLTPSHSGTVRDRRIQLFSFYRLLQVRDSQNSGWKKKKEEKSKVTLMYRFMFTAYESVNGILAVLTNHERSSVKFSSRLWSHWRTCLYTRVWIIW